MIFIDNDQLYNELLWQRETKSAVVLLAGQVPQDKRWLQIISHAGFLAAADGGAALALHLGRCPNLLVGDFDSLDAALVKEAAQGGATLVQLPVMKDVTDGEYLLQRLAEQGFCRLLVLGALGGRVDMQMANIYTAASFARRGVSCLLAQDDALLVPLFAGDEPAELVLRGFAGKTFSQVSISERCKNIRLDGFLYPLDGELKRGQTLGLSNIIKQKEASLQLVGGSLLTIINL